MNPDLVVCLPDGRTFTRHPPTSQSPPGTPGFEEWARYLAAALEMVLEDEGKPGDGADLTMRWYASRDFARDALLGWAQWSETPFKVRWR